MLLSTIMFRVFIMSQPDPGLGNTCLYHAAARLLPRPFIRAADTPTSVSAPDPGVDYIR